jgi:hypothetical protein
MSFAEEFGNVVYERTDQRETIYAAWNRALGRARGTYVMSANTDDRWRQDAFELLSSRLNEHSDVALVYADSAITESPDESFESAPIVGVMRWPEFSEDVLFTESCFGPHPMWRRSLHEQYGLFDASFEVAGDYEWWLRIARSETLLHVPEVLGLYYLSENTLGRRDSELVREEIQRARERHWSVERGPMPPYGTDYVDAVGVLGRQRQRQVSELRQCVGALEEARDWYQQHVVAIEAARDWYQQQVVAIEAARDWYQQQAEAWREQTEALGKQAEAWREEAGDLRARLNAIERSRVYRSGVAARHAIRATTTRAAALGRVVRKAR